MLNNQVNQVQPTPMAPPMMRPQAPPPMEYEGGDGGGMDPMVGGVMKKMDDVMSISDAVDNIVDRIEAFMDHRAFDKADMDGSGDLSLEEYQASMPGEMAGKAIDTFGRYDSNNDGKVDGEEFHRGRELDRDFADFKEKFAEARVPPIAKLKMAMDGMKMAMEEMKMDMKMEGKMDPEMGDPGPEMKPNGLPT